MKVLRVPQASRYFAPPPTHTVISDSDSDDESLPSPGLNPANNTNSFIGSYLNSLNREDYNKAIAGEGKFEGGNSNSKPQQAVTICTEQTNFNDGIASGSTQQQVALEAPLTSAACMRCTAAKQEEINSNIRDFNEDKTFLVKLNELSSADEFQVPHVKRCYCCLNHHSSFAECGEFYEYLIKVMKASDVKHCNIPHIRCLCCLKSLV